MLTIEEKLLTFNNIQLKLLNHTHFETLTQVASDARIWQNHHIKFYQPDIFKVQWLKQAWDSMQAQLRYVFAVFLNDKLIGSSSYYDINPKYKKLKIGYTWYHPDYWGHGVNPVVKYLLLQYAFETLMLNRVGFTVDSINNRSRGALEKLHIPFEGIMKNDMIRADGSLRDSAIYAVITQDWSQVKQHIADHYLHEQNKKID